MQARALELNRGARALRASHSTKRHCGEAGPHLTLLPAEPLALATPSPPRENDTLAAYSPEPRRVLDGNSQPGHDPSPAFDDMSEEELGAEKAKVHHYLKGIGSTCWRFY